MQVIFLYAVAVAAQLISAYYLPAADVTVTIKLPAFTTIESIETRVIVRAADTSKSAPCTKSSSSIAAKAIETPPCSTITSSKVAKAIAASEPAKPASNATAKATRSLSAEHCVTHTVCYKSFNTAHVNSNKTATLKATAKAVSNHSGNSTHTSASPAACTNPSLAKSNITLPSFPLSANTTSNLSAFLNLILSVPESVFTKGDADVSTFFSGLGSCLANGGKGLETDLSALVSPISSFVAGFSANILPAVESSTTDAGEAAKDIGKGIGDKLGSIFHTRDAAAFNTLLSDVEKISACMSNVASNSTAFDIGKCAVDLALLVSPVGKLGKIRNLIGAAGGVIKVLQDLKDGLSAEKVALGSVKVFEEVLGVTGTVKACTVAVDAVKNTL